MVDPTDIPLSTIVSTFANQDDVNTTALGNNTFTLVEEEIDRDEEGAFVPTGHSESIWAYTTDGRMWSATLGG